MPRQATQIERPADAFEAAKAMQAERLPRDIGP